ncbi:MAG TPA: PQQ-binding-like beta-propeller repeat protein, partial [Gemmatales bacterium]|nr:PQQ-binding-like beta-propeller repeat protein [Gemmatales bacterium]
MLLHALVIVLFSSSLSQIADWPQLRGPTGHGHYAGKLPTRWSEQENIVWSLDLPGLGWSSPITVAGKIYLTTAIKNDDESHSLRALCIDFATGQEVWNTEVFVQPRNAPRIHSKNSHASPSPIINDGKCYVHFGHMGTACLDDTGQILWKQQEHRYKPTHGNGGSPCLVKNHLIFSCDGEDMQAVIALDASTGATAWKVERKASPGRPFSFGTPLHIQHDGISQVISAGSDVVMSLNPKTGQEYWRFQYQGYSQIPVPLYHHGLIYICTGYDTPKLLAIRAGGNGNITETHLA